jgi:hypothetical protein
MEGIYIFYGIENSYITSCKVRLLTDCFFKMMWIDVELETVPVREEKKNMLNLKYFIFASYKSLFLINASFYSLFSHFLDIYMRGCW